MKKLVSALALGLTLALSSCTGASGPAGDYSLDVEGFANAMMSKMGDAASKMPAEAKTKMLDEMKKNINGMMSIKADNTWSMDMKMKMMGQENNSKVTGTWKLEGEKITMVGKEEGKEKEDTITGTYKDNKLTLSKDGQTMVFMPKK